MPSFLARALFSANNHEGTDRSRDKDEAAGLWSQIQIQRLIQLLGDHIASITPESNDLDDSAIIETAC